MPPGLFEKLLLFGQTKFLNMNGIVTILVDPTYNLFDKRFE